MEQQATGKISASGPARLLVVQFYGPGAYNEITGGIETNDDVSWAVDYTVASSDDDVMYTPYDPNGGLTDEHIFYKATFAPSERWLWGAKDSITRNGPGTYDGVVYIVYSMIRNAWPADITQIVAKLEWKSVWDGQGEPPVITYSYSWL